MNQTVALTVTPYNMVDRYQHFGETYRLHLQGIRWEQHVPPKYWKILTTLPDVITLMTTISNLHSCNTGDLK
jgi:hypothetical protein